jgi:hypothetical protein
MKWREPWGVSLRHQARFDPLGKPVRTTFLGLFGAFAVVFIMASWGKDAAGWWENLTTVSWIVPVFSAVLALFVRLVTWLSPRRIDYAPHGIIVFKAEDMLLIPWGAIGSHRFTTVEGDAALEITTLAGEVIPLFLPSTISRAAIERELAEHMRKAAAHA